MKTLAIAILVLLFTTASLAHEAGNEVTVHSVVKGSPAAAAGVRTGDRIVRLGDRAVTSATDLKAAIAAIRPGATVKLTVVRDGQTIEMPVTLGRSPSGGGTIGVGLAVPTVGVEADPTPGGSECLAWIDGTYRLESLIQEHHLDLDEEYQSAIRCVRRNLNGLASEKAVQYCDPILKVHCSAIDLLTEVAEARVQWCESRLEASLGIKPGAYETWRTCGRNRVFDAYSMKGEVADEAACRKALLEQCGADIGGEIQAGSASADQRRFADCCVADSLDAASGAECDMIDDSFDRGPCLDRPVCVHRSTGEWFDCSALR